MLAPARISCFVDIPQAQEFDSVRQAVYQGLAKSGVEPLESSDAPASLSPVTSDIIERADFIIAEVSRPSSNIFYVLGIADSLRKPTLMLAQRQAELSPEMARREVLLYGPGEESKLTEYLGFWLSSVLEIQRQRSFPARQA